MLKISLILLAASLTGSCLSMVDSGRDYRENTRAGDQAYQKKDYATAEKHYKLALSIAERDGPGRPDAIITLRSLGQLYDATDRFAEAEEVFKRRTKLGEGTWAKNAGMLSTVYDDLALFYLRHKRYEDAKPIYDRAIKIRRDAFGESSPEVVSSLKLYASLLRLGGQDGEANQMTERASAIKARQGASPSQR